MKNPLQLDHAGGAALFNLADHELCVQQDNLQSLDIINAHLLRYLHLLGTCKGSRHLQLRNADTLEVISNQGADDLVLHLESNNFMTGLCIKSAVSHLDAAWTNPSGIPRTLQCSFANNKQQPNATHWQQVYLTDTDNLDVLATAEPDDLVVINAERYPGEQLSLKGKAAMVLLHPTLVTDLEIRSENMVQVIGEGSALSRVKLAAPSAEFHDCEALQTLQTLDKNSIDTLLIKDSHSTQLEIAVGCNTLTITNCNTQQLKFLHANTLRVHSCPSIKHIESDSKPFYELSGMVCATLLEHARFAINESIMHNQLLGIDNPQDDKLLSILNMVPMQMRSRDVSQGLLVLERAREIGVDIETVWSLRNELNHNHLQNTIAGIERSDNQPAQWRWKLHGDGLNEAWRADFRLWADAYIAGVESARMLRKPIGTTMINHDSALWAATHCLKYRPVALSFNLWAQLTRQMNKVWRRNHRFDKIDKAHPQINQFVSYAVKAVLDTSANQVNAAQADEDGLTDFKQALVQLVTSPPRIEP